MTIQEAIQRVDELKPNTFSRSDKVEWLSTLDGMIYRLILINYQGTEEMTFEGYDDDAPLTTELLVKEPFTEMYITWLESKIDYHNGEYVKYNNSITRYNDIWTEYVRDYNRTHIHKTTNFHGF